jgi:hypothetical protein
LIAGDFLTALGRLIGQEEAHRHAQRFQPLDGIIFPESGILGREALAAFIYTTPLTYHETINADLWSEAPGDDTRIVAEALNTCLSKLTRFRGMAYRGFRPKGALDTFLEKYTPGALVIMPGFTSASRTREKAFAGNVLFTIQSRTGAITWYVSAEFMEDEIIFRTDTTFRVLHVERLRNRAIIELEEV